MREQPNIPENEIQSLLHEEYNLADVTVEFLPLGLDTRAGVYRIESAQGKVYLLKVTGRPLYKASLDVPRYLWERGVKSVVTPFRTPENKLHTTIRGWTAMLYEFVSGISGWGVRLNDAQWRNLGATVRQIQSTNLPESGFEAIKRETFNPSGYGDWIREFEATELGIIEGAENERNLRDVWRKHQVEINRGMQLIEQLGRQLREHPLKQVICHADLHPGNMIRNEADEVFIVDWDEVMLAPKERDFLFVKGVLAENRAEYPFFQGYEQVEINWPSLTYFLWERVITDLIVSAQDVFRDDLEDQTKKEAIELFEDVMSADGEVATARAAEAHLP